MNTNIAPVPPFRVEFSDEEIAQAIAHTESILRSGWLILGQYTEQFEREVAALVGTRYAVAVNSGTSALEIILRSLEVAGKDVLVPTNTNFASAAAALYAQANVILYDGGLYPSLTDIERKITPQTAAIMVVHIGGYITPEIEEIRALCEAKNIYLIEDAAHAHCATFGGKQAGSFGHAAGFSFFPTKVITTCEGGMITTDSEQVYEKARQYRNQGKDSSEQHVVMGNSWRLSEIEAALGLVQLQSLARDTAYRQQVIRDYQALLTDDTPLAFPQLPAAMAPSGYKCIALLAAGTDREAIKALMKQRGIILGRGVYEMPLHRQPVFATLAGDAFPLADDFCDRHICLPLWRFIADEQVQRVVQAFKQLDRTGPSA